MSCWARSGIAKQGGRPWNWPDRGSIYTPPYMRRARPGSGAAYTAKLMTLKRSAMTDVLLGEIRDRETGRAFMDLAGSGINLYTTVHAPCAALVGERLASDFIGVSRDFLATPGILKLIVHQALLPKLCAHCALPASSLLRGAVA